MRILMSFVPACLALLLVACNPAPQAAVPAGPVTASLDTLPATVEGTLFFDLDGGADGDGTQTHGSLLFGDDHLSVMMPTALARSLEVPEDGVRVRVTVGSEVVDDGDSTLVITAAQRL